jgi:hypothetical protein
MRREHRRLNALARGRLRAQRAAEPRLPEPAGAPARVRCITQSAQRLVAVLDPVLGCWPNLDPPRYCQVSAPLEC